MFYLCAFIWIPVLIIVSFYINGDRGLREAVPNILLLLAMEFVGGVVMLWVIKPLTPHTADAYLNCLDAGFGLGRFGFARFVWQRPLLLHFLNIVYWSITAVLAALLAAETKMMRRILIISLFLALVIYYFVPAAGPRYTYPGYPFGASSGQHLLLTSAARNCFPSMHFAWALWVVYNVKGRYWITAAVVFAFLTGLATVGRGEHYFVDLVAAVPFSLGIQWLAEGWENLFSRSQGYARDLEVGDFVVADNTRR